MSDDRAVVDWPAIPLAGDRVSVDRERLVRRADLRPAEVGHHRTPWHRGHQATMRIAEARSLIFSELDRVSVFMDIAMVQATEQCRILQAGLASVGPVLDVVAFQEDPVCTSGVRTRRIALVQRTLERPSNRAALAPDRQRCAMFALDDLDHTGITAES